jgi:hypothetical protein
MSVHTQYPTHLKRSIFTKIRSESHDIPATIVSRIAYVGNLTGKDMPTSCAVLYLYRLLRHDSSIYALFNAHLLP